MRVFRRTQWLPWLAIGLLALLCVALGILQYRWIGQIAAAERTTLQESLQQQLFETVQDFNSRIESELRYITFGDGEPQTRLGEWNRSHEPLLSRVLISSEPGGHAPDTIEIPMLRDAPEQPQRWLQVRLDLNYIRNTVIPELVNSHLAKSGTLDYDIEVSTTSDAPQLIYASFPNAQVWTRADASAPMIDVRVGGRGGGGRPGGQGTGGFRGPPPGFNGPPPGPPRGTPGGPGRRFGPERQGPERWRMLARHKAGSLQALVASTQRRNLGVSVAVLLLIVGTIALLLNYSRKTQRLAELQMNFVTGVSHELRTPLTVIRTAAFNLRNPELRRNEEKVQRYGSMIEAESGKLESLVNQVLRFASASAGQAVQMRAQVSISALLQHEIDAIQSIAEERHITLETDIDGNMPDIAGDPEALRQAIRNLLDNALKYGTETTPIGAASWIGVSAHRVHMGERQFIEISVADRGPGIPDDEQRQIFDPFVRGRRAIRDQKHGTGLGLNLVKSIAEAHGGSVSVTSGAGGSRFTLRIPV